MMIGGRDVASESHVYTGSSPSHAARKAARKFAPKLTGRFKPSEAPQKGKKRKLSPVPKGAITLLVREKGTERGFTFLVWNIPLSQKKRQQKIDAFKKAGKDPLSFVKKKQWEAKVRKAEQIQRIKKEIGQTTILEGTIRPKRSRK